MNISDLYGLDIYDAGSGKYVGKVNDVILNLETGNIVRLTTEPLRAVSKQQAKVVLRDKSILYKNVVTVGDVVLVSRGGVTVQTEKEAESAKPLRRLGIRRRSLLGRTR